MNTGTRSGVAVEIDGDLCVVSIDRPPANAMDDALLERGIDIAVELAAATPGAVVLTGTGRFFSGGMDLKFLADIDGLAQRDLVSRINEFFLRWYTLPVPVVCAVNGHAVAGGLVLALCADARLAVAQARYGLTEVAVGVPFPVSAAGIVAAELAPGVARRLALDGELRDGTSMLELGVFDALVEPEQLLSQALDAATRRASHSPRAYRLAKQSLRGAAAAQIAAAIDRGNDPALVHWLGDGA